MTARVVVVGASIGGLTAAETLREEGYSGEIVLIGDEPHLPYNRPPLSKQILAGNGSPRRPPSARRPSSTSVRSA